MDIQTTLKNQLHTILQDLGIEVGAIELTHPQIASQGDYSTNVAMIAAKKAGKNPRDLAEEIISNDKYPMTNIQYVEKVVVAGPGFINFYLHQSYFIEALGKLLKDNKESLKTSFTDKKVMVEFTDPNPFKELHIGHLYDNTIGESLSRLIEAGGADVKRVTYQGDVGLHVAKSLYGLQEKMVAETQTLSDLEQLPLKQRIKYLGEAYALGSTAYEDDEAAKLEIIRLNKAVYEKESSIKDLYEKGREWSLSYFDEIYARLGSHFWKNYFESEAGPIGLKLVQDYLKQGVFEESEGAVIFPGDKHGLHARVFINSQGLPTYEAKELGLAPTKFSDYQYDISIIITGNEINEYFKVLMKALSIINPELAEKTKHISHGMVRLPEGKMSSRTGNIRTGEWLLDEAYKRAWMIIQKTTKTQFEGDHVNYSDHARVKPSEQNPVAEIVAIAAVKYALLKSSIGKDIEFNFDDSVTFEGNSGPYLQYTYVRTRSVFNKLNLNTIELNLESNINQIDKGCLDLIKKLVCYEEVLIDSIENLSPSALATYLFELAQIYNNFYQNVPIFSSMTDAHRNNKTLSLELALNILTGKTIKQGLQLLGIQAPEKM